MGPTVNVYFKLSIDGKGAFHLQMKLQCCLMILNLAWLDTTNSVVYVLLEIINLMLLKPTRWAWGAIGHLQWCLGIADLISTYTRQGIQLLVSITD